MSAGFVKNNLSTGSKSSNFKRLNKMPEKEVKVISQAKMLKFIADTYTHEDEAFLEIEKMLNKGDIRIQNVHVLADIRKLAKTALELKNE